MESAFLVHRILLEYSGVKETKVAGAKDTRLDFW